MIFPILTKEYKKLDNANSIHVQNVLINYNNGSFKYEYNQAFIINAPILLEKGPPVLIQSYFEVTRKRRVS